MATKSTHAEIVRRYYDGCSTGDVELMLSTLVADVVHYFLAPNPGSKPVHGGEHLARYWRKVHRLIDATWIVDHIIDGRDEAAIEWSMYWRTDGSDARVVTRGSEWFRFREGRISEIRSYYQQRDESTELDDFPYAGSGYSMLSAERSVCHQGVSSA
jgi:ketosteroid isomerase-like protein